MLHLLKFKINFYKHKILLKRRRKVTNLSTSERIKTFIKYVKSMEYLSSIIEISIMPSNRVGKNMNKRTVCSLNDHDSLTLHQTLYKLFWSFMATSNQRILRVSDIIRQKFIAKAIASLESSFWQGREYPASSCLLACITYLLQVEKQHFSILDHPGGFFDFDFVWKITVDDRRLTLDAAGQSFFRDRHRHVLGSCWEVHFQRHFDLELKND